MKLPLVANNVFTESENAFTARHLRMAHKTLTAIQPRIPSESELEAYEAIRRRFDAKKTIQAAILQRHKIWSVSKDPYVPAVDRLRATVDYLEMCDAIDKADDTYFRLYGERVDNDFQMQTGGKVC